MNEGMNVNAAQGVNIHNGMTPMAGHRSRR